MRIAGLQKLTLIDYPGKVAATVFTRGCNLRCRYCHNPELVISQCLAPLIPPEEVLAFLTRRVHLLEGVVITGGEPTLQPDLVNFLRQIKKLDYAIKLDTNGTFPDRLETIFQQGLVDYIAMDIKTSLEKYDDLTAVHCNTENIERSIKLIRHSGIAFEFRTTVIKPYGSVDDLQKIKTLLGAEDNYRLQYFRQSEKMVDISLLKEEHYSQEELIKLQKEFALYI